MKTINLLVLFGIFSVLLSCKQNLPEGYGIYLQTGNEYKQIHPQKTYDRGTIVESIKGIKGTSGASIKEINSIIVYQHKIDPNVIKLSKLYFLYQKTFRGFIGSPIERVELWVPTEKIPVIIQPVKNQIDMYRVIPKNPLDDGFYAIHFGSLITNSSPFEYKHVYDFVIGTNVEDYTSVEEIRKKEERLAAEERRKEEQLAAKNDSIMFIKAKELLEKNNQYYNSKSFSEIRNIQKKEDGSNFNDQEWTVFQNGLENWFSLAGKVNSSKILNKQINKNIGNFLIQSDYQKAGKKQERLKVIRLHDDYYITFLGQ
jgi:hypothetical protein